MNIRGSREGAKTAPYGSLPEPKGWKSNGLSSPVYVFISYESENIQITKNLISVLLMRAKKSRKIQK
eukprot:bmy_19954T0